VTVVPSPVAVIEKVPMVLDVYVYPLQAGSVDDIKPILRHGSASRFGLVRLSKSSNGGYHGRLKLGLPWALELGARYRPKETLLCRPPLLCPRGRPMFGKRHP